MEDPHAVAPQKSFETTAPQIDMVIHDATPSLFAQVESEELETKLEAQEREFVPPMPLENKKYAVEDPAETRAFHDLDDVKNITDPDNHYTIPDIDWRKSDEIVFEDDWIKDIALNNREENDVEDLIINYYNG